MRLLIALTVAFVVAGAGVARADDCDFEGAHGNSLSPVTLTGGSGVVVQDTFADDGTLDEWFLPRRDRDGVFAPTRRCRRRSSAAARSCGATGRSSTARRACSSAASRSPGTTASPRAGAPTGRSRSSTTPAAARWSSGSPRTARSPRRSPCASVGPRPFLPQLTVDAHGTAFGQFHGVVLLWPANGTPQLLSGPSTPAAARRRPTRRRLAVGGRPLGSPTSPSAGVDVVHVPADTVPVVDAQGDAVVAWSSRGRTHIARVTPDGVVEADSVLRSDGVEAVALGPGDTPWVVAHAGRELVVAGAGPDPRPARPPRLLAGRRLPGDRRGPAARGRSGTNRATGSTTRATSGTACAGRPSASTPTASPATCWPARTHPDNGDL